MSLDRNRGRPSRAGRMSTGDLVSRPHRSLLRGHPRGPPWPRAPEPGARSPAPRRPPPPRVTFTPPRRPAWSGLADALGSRGPVLSCPVRPPSAAALGPGAGCPQCPRERRVWTRPPCRAQPPPAAPPLTPRRTALLPALRPSTPGRPPGRPRPLLDPLPSELRWVGCGGGWGAPLSAPSPPAAPGPVSAALAAPPAHARAARCPGWPRGLAARSRLLRDGVPRADRRALPPLCRG